MDELARLESAEAQLRIGVDERLARLESEKIGANEHLARLESVRIAWIGIDERLARLEAEMRKHRDWLLMGSLGCNMLDVALLFVYGEAKLKMKRRKIKSIEELENDQLSSVERERWQDFKTRQWGNVKWDAGWGEVLFDLAKARGLERPATYKDDDDENDVISSEQLQKVATNLFTHRRSPLKDKLPQIHCMIDFLDHVTRDLQRPLLC